MPLESSAFDQAVSSAANPLQGMTSINDAYNNALAQRKGALDIQKTYGEQAVGNALQQATDEQGNLDVAKAQRIASQMGPNAAFAMQGFLKTGSELRGNQIKQNLTINDAVNGAVTAALASDDANLKQAVIEQAGRLRGILPADQVDHALLHLSSDPAQLRAQLETLRVQSLPPQQRQNWIYGTRPTITTPNATYMPEVPEPGRGPPVTIVTPHGVAPVAPVVPDTRPGAPPGTYTPVIPPGGGGGPPTAVPIQPQPGVQPGRVRPPAGSPLLNPAAPPPAAAPAPAPAAPGAPPAAPPAAAAPTTAGNQPTYTAPPAGQEDTLKKDIEARTAANTAMPDQQKRFIAGNTALQALDLASTGPGTGVTSRMYAFLQAQSPGSATPQGALSDTAWRQVLVKNLLRFAQSSSPRASTDQQLSTQIESNPNPEQLAPAIHHILVQDLGVLKRDIAQTQEMPQPSGTGDVVKHIGSFSTKIAPEAFEWNHYSGDERAAIEAQYARDGKTKQLHDSLELAVRRGAIPDPRKAASVTPPAVVAPPPPAPNALVPTN